MNLPQTPIPKIFAWHFVPQIVPVPTQYISAYATHKNEQLKERRVINRNITAIFPCVLISHDYDFQYPVSSLYSAELPAGVFSLGL